MCHRKTTIILFKILGIERAWQNRGNVDLRPRQIFITKSRRLANKVEEEYVNLLFSLCQGFDMPEDVRERIQCWNGRKKIATFDPDDDEDHRDDLPPRYSQLQDGHFPLFITTDTVSMFHTSGNKNSSGVHLTFLCTALQPSRGRYESESPDEGTTLLFQRCHDFRHLQQGILATPSSTLDQRRRCVLKISHRLFFNLTTHIKHHRLHLVTSSV